MPDLPSSTLPGTVSVSLVRAQLLGAAGLDLDRLAHLAGCPQLLHSGPGERIPVQVFARLIRMIWDALGSESGGFTERAQPPGLFSMMCHASISCPNLRRALLRGSRFYALVQEEMRIELHERGDEALLYIRHQNRRALDDRGFIESLMVIWLRWSSWLIGAELPPERILFSFVPGDYAEEYPRMFPCDHYFRANANCVVFPARYLDYPLVRSSADLADFLASAPESLMRRYIEEPTLATTVRRLVRARSDHASVGLDEVAAALGTSSQTLRRRLREEGSGFQQIKDLVRKEHAVQQLLASDQPINEIAAAVGFSEPSAFHRAFKKWTGLTPGAYRENAED